MSVYKFYDTDITGRAEYDICGDDYIELLETCIKYSETFSFRIWNENEKIDLPEFIEQYRIPATDETVKVYGHYYSELSQQAKEEIHHYRLCPQFNEWLLSVTDSIFKWICGWGYTNPDDPAFFRTDGSAFFSSVIHEGVCMLMPRDNEDVSSLISKGNWIASDGENIQ